MKKLQGRAINYAAALLVSAVMAAPPTIVAQNHVVSPGDMQSDVSAASASRQRNQQQLRDFLSTKEARQAMKSANVNPQQVTNAVSQLSDEELASLAARSQKAQTDFAAGFIGHDIFLLIVGGILAIILIAVFA